MKEIIEKLNIIKDEIISESNQGILRFFVLIKRTDQTDKWDILLSADWFKKTNSQDDLIYFIKKIKSQFSSLDFIARILLATPDDLFIKSLAGAILKSKENTVGDITNLKVPEVDTVLKNINVIHIDFSGIDLNNKGRMIGPLAVKNNEDF